MAVQIDLYMAGVAVLDEEPDDGEDLDDANLLEFRLLPGKESYSDHNISENLICQQRSLSKNWSRSMQTYSRKDHHSHLEQHRIETITKDPIELKYYPMLYAMPEIIKEEVEAMLEADIIEPSRSVYCSLVVIVKKKDDSNRFCINFRKLNLMSKVDTQPMGNPDDIMAK